MPAILAVLPAILSATAAATTIGTSIYNLQDYKGPDTNQPALDTAAQAKTDATNAANVEAEKTALIRRAAPDAQAATGGALAPDSFAAFTSMLAGMPGDNQLAQRILNGGTAGVPNPTDNSGFTPSSSSISPTMATMSGGSDSGSGSPVPSSSSNGIMDMISKLFSGGGISGGDGAGLESMRGALTA